MSSIELFFEDIQPFSIQKAHLNTFVKHLIINEIKRQGDISVVFCSDNYLLEMNKEYLEHDYFTDIITFDYVEENVISGDLFISYDRVVENAQNLNIEVIKELYRVVFHGILHLCGYKDKTNEEQKLMTEKENYYLGEVDFSRREL